MYNIFNLQSINCIEYEPHIILRLDLLPSCWVARVSPFVKRKVIKATVDGMIASTGTATTAYNRVRKYAQATQSFLNKSVRPEGFAI